MMGQAGARALETRPLSPNLGVEVLNHDFSVAPDAGRVREILDLADRHFLLLFRNQPITEDQQVAFTGRLGPMVPPPEKAFSSTSNPMVLRLGNVGMDGRQLPADDPSTAFTYLPERWHSDGAYKPVPNYLTMLHALEIPPEGGETWFASMVAAYNAAPNALRARLEGRVMEHPYRAKEMTVGDWTGSQIDVVRHPLIRDIPGGQKSLFVGVFGGSISGLGQEEADALVKEVIDFATQSAFTYRHKWRVGDTLLWNNRGVYHTARPWDRVKHRRLMQRTEISDAHGYAAGQASVVDDDLGLPA